MEPLKKTIAKSVTPKQRAKVLFALRQTTGQAILAAGTMAFIAQNLSNFKANFALAVGAVVVALVLYFANKR